MDLHDLYNSENVVTMVKQKDEMGAPYDTPEEKRNVCRILVGKLAEKRVLERGSDSKGKKQVF